MNYSYYNTLQKRKLGTTRGNKNCNQNLSKKNYGKENAGDRKNFHDPRLPVYRDTEKANQNIFDKSES